MQEQQARQMMTKHDIRAVPVLGEVKAGNPMYADGNIRDYVALPDRHLPIGDVFVLDVIGDSMIGDGILDGDQVLIVPYHEPKGKGEMIVALIDDAATVKRLYRSPDGSSFQLEPSNPAYESTIIRADEFLIQGRVIGVMRWKIK